MASTTSTAMTSWLSHAVAQLRKGSARIIDESDEKDENDHNNNTNANDIGAESCENNDGSDKSKSTVYLLYSDCLQRIEEEEQEEESKVLTAIQSRNTDDEKAEKEWNIHIIAPIEMLMELGAHDFAKERFGRAIDNFTWALKKITRSKEASPVQDNTIESLNTKVLYYLAQAYQLAGDAASSARYCAATLKRQLLTSAAPHGSLAASSEGEGESCEGEGDQSGFDASSWIYNCLTLAGYFLRDEKDFATANHCTAVAASVFHCYYDRNAKNGTDDTNAIKQTTASSSEDDKRAMCANVQLAWGKLCGFLLRQDHQSLSEEEKTIDDNTDDKSDKPNEPSTSRKLAIDFTDVVDLNCAESSPPIPDVLPEQCSQMMTRDGNDNHSHSLPLKIHVSDTALARHVFNIGMTAFNRSLEYYTIDSWATECCEIIIDRNNLFIGGCRFEPDKKRQISLHRLRAKVVAPLIKQLNKDAFPGLYRSLNFEAAEAHAAIFDLRMYDAASTVTLDSGRYAKAATWNKKRHELILQSGDTSTSFYQAIIASYNDCSDEQDGTLSIDEHHLLLKVHFSIARVYHKLSTCIEKKLNREGNTYGPSVLTDDKTSARAYAIQSIDAFETFSECFTRLCQDDENSASDIVVDGFTEKNDIANELSSLLRIKYGYVKA